MWHAWGRRENHMKCQSETMKSKNHVAELGVGGRIKSKRTTETECESMNLIELVEDKV
jgi:hypothetical protein